jgi:hypothetical protein
MALNHKLIITSGTKTDEEGQREQKFLDYIIKNLCSIKDLSRFEAAVIAVNEKINHMLDTEACDIGDTHLVEDCTLCEYLGLSYELYQDYEILYMKSDLLRHLDWVRERYFFYYENTSMGCVSFLSSEIRSWITLILRDRKI